MGALSVKDIGMSGCGNEELGQGRHGSSDKGYGRS